MNFFEQGSSIEKTPESKITLSERQELFNTILSCKENQECIQEACNSIFDEAKREELLKKASVDTKGRKVRYYRQIEENTFLRALYEGKHAVSNNHLEDFDRNLSEEKVKEFFCDYVDFQELASWDEIDNLDLRGLLQKIVPNNNQEIENFLGNVTNRKIVEFIEKYCKKSQIESLHAGSLYPEFSPYLSASVGGSFVRYPKKGYILLEMIIADDKISSLPSEAVSREGEKHVYIQGEITLDEISRTFTTAEQYMKEILRNENIPIGEWIKEKDEENVFNGVEQWRWAEPTDDCLPVEILKRNENNEDFY